MNKYITWIKKNMKSQIWNKEEFVDLLYQYYPDEMEYRFPEELLVLRIKKSQHVSAETVYVRGAVHYEQFKDLEKWYKEWKEEQDGYKRDFYKLLNQYVRVTGLRCNMIPGPYKLYSMDLVYENYSSFTLLTNATSQQCNKYLQWYNEFYQVKEKPMDNKITELQDLIKKHEEDYKSKIDDLKKQLEDIQKKAKEKKQWLPKFKPDWQFQSNYYFPKPTKFKYKINSFRNEYGTYHYETGAVCETKEEAIAIEEWQAACRIIWKWIHEHDALIVTSETEHYTLFRNKKNHRIEMSLYLDSNTNAFQFKTKQLAKQCLEELGYDLWKKYFDGVRF